MAMVGPLGAKAAVAQLSSSYHAMCEELRARVRRVSSSVGAVEMTTACCPSKVFARHDWRFAESHSASRRELASLHLNHIPRHNRHSWTMLRRRAACSIQTTHAFGTI
jgi:hypothetical protein